MGFTSHSCSDSWTAVSERLDRIESALNQTTTLLMAMAERFGARTPPIGWIRISEAARRLDLTPVALDRRLRRHAERGVGKPVRRRFGLVNAADLKRWLEGA